MIRYVVIVLCSRTIFYHLKARKPAKFPTLVGIGLEHEDPIFIFTNMVTYKIKDSSYNNISSKIPMVPSLYPLIL